MDQRFSSCLAKQERVKKIFTNCKTSTEIYEKIIGLGRALGHFPDAWKTSEHLVSGCQSQVYLHTELMDGKVRFAVGADALISAGLAALLLAVYNDEPPEAVLGCPPAFLEAWEFKLP
jgi:sulfur transfer protein SufE